MFSNRDFCMEKLLAKGSYYFLRKKLKVLIFYYKLIKPIPNCKKNLPGVQMFEYSQQICQNPKLKIFGLSPLPIQKTLFKNTFGH